MDWTVFVISLVGFCAFILLMSVGYMFAGKTIKGSCGGINAAMTNDDGKKVCGLCGIEVSDPKVKECQSNP